MKIHLMRLYDENGELAAEAPLIVHKAEALPDILRLAYPSAIPMVAGMILRALYLAAETPEEKEKQEAAGLNEFTGIVLALHPPKPPSVQTMEED